MNEFSNPWRDCPSCYQYYQNKLAIDWRPSLTHLSEGSIQAIRKCRWNLLMWNCLLSIRCLSVCNLGKREKLELLQMWYYPWLIGWKEMHHRCQGVIPNFKRSHTTHMVLLLSEKERKRVQEGLWLILKSTWKCMKQWAMMRALPL